MKFIKISTTSKYRTKQEIVYDEIKNAIINCESDYEPGGQLIIRSLASKLQVSESPVREALKSLISENFVVEQCSNLYVAPISAYEFLDMLEVKLGIEKLALRSAINKIDKEKIDYLYEILSDMKASYTQDNMQDYKRQHNIFHLELCRMCDVSYLVSAVEAAFSHHERGLNYFKLVLWEGKGPSIEDHESILNSIVSNNSEKAEEYFVNNRRKAYDLYKKQMRVIIDIIDNENKNLL